MPTSRRSWADRHTCSAMRYAMENAPIGSVRRPRRGMHQVPVQPDSRDHARTGRGAHDLMGHMLAQANGPPATDGQMTGGIACISTENIIEFNVRVPSICSQGFIGALQGQLTQRIRRRRRARLLSAGVSGIVELLRRAVRVLFSLLFSVRPRDA